MDFVELDVWRVGKALECASLMAGCRYQGSSIGVAFRPQLCLVSAQLIRIDVRIDLVFHRDQMPHAIAPVARIDPNIDPAIGHGLLRSYKNLVHFLLDKPVNEIVSKRGTGL